MGASIDFSKADWLVNTDQVLAINGDLLNTTFQRSSGFAGKLTSAILLDGIQPSGGECSRGCLQRPSVGAIPFTAD